MSLKPITLFSHFPTPNPPKVAILLEELKVPYEVVKKEFGNGPNGVKHPDFTKYNPNGRVPAIIDSNRDVVVWESGAILQYIQKHYDTENKFGASNPQDEADILSWLFFQVSGHGPSQGQVNWFTHFQPGDKIIPAIERYTNETKRIYGVLDNRLKDREFIVSDHFTIVDIAFFPWVKIITFAGIDLETVIKSEFPNVYAWFKRLESRPSIVKAYETLSK